MTSDFRKYTSFAVEGEGVAGNEEGVRRPGGGRHASGPFRLHARLRSLVRENLGRVGGTRTRLPGEVSRDDRLPRARDRHVTACVIEMGVRVDDEANRLAAGQAPHFREDRVGDRRRA
jgi:hypothetical protein